MNTRWGVAHVGKKFGSHFMTAEEVGRAIGFLLESQAKHDAQLGELRDQVAETNRIVQMHADTQSQFIEIVSHTLEALGASQRRTDSRNETITQAISSLIESQRRTDERFGETDARIDRMVEAAARTDERLDRMIEASAQADARIAEVEARNSRRYDELDARLDRLVGVVERLAEARG
jgi:chromosome segregation ATPase